MRNDSIKSTNVDDIKALEPIIDYEPKNYSFMKQILWGLKMLSIGGIIFLSFWLIEKMHLYY